MPGTSRAPARRWTGLLFLLALTAAAGQWWAGVARDTGGNAPDPELDRGLALLRRGDARGAAAVFTHVSDRRPQDAEVAYLLGLAWFHAGELRPAAAALEQSVRLRPDFVEGHRRLGEIYARAREYSLAAASLERARKLAPRDATTLIQIGRLDLTTGEVERAAAALREAIRFRPGSGAAHALLGEAERLAGPPHWKAAESEFRRALELDPRNADAHHRLGWLALQAGRPDQALPSLRAAVQLDPELAPAWYLRGEAAQRAGRPDEARQAFLRFQQFRARTGEAGG